MLNLFVVRLQARTAVRGRVFIFWAKRLKDEWDRSLIILLCHVLHVLTIITIFYLAPTEYRNQLNYSPLIIKKSSLKDIEVSVEWFPEVHLIDFHFSLHSLLHTVLSLRTFVALVKRPQTLVTHLFWVVTLLDVVHPLGPSQRLRGFETHCSDLTLSKVPMLDWRNFVNWRAKRLLKTWWIVEVNSTASRTLVRKIKIYLNDCLLDFIRSLRGSKWIPLPNLLLFSPFHSSEKSL